MIASSKGHSSVVRKLLQAGATVDATNKVCKWTLGATHALYPCAFCMWWCGLFMFAVFTDAVHVHAHTYHRMGGLLSTLQHMRMLWNSCLKQTLIQNWKQRSLFLQKLGQYLVLQANCVHALQANCVHAKCVYTDWLTTNGKHCLSWEVSCYWPHIYNCITTLKSGCGQLQYTWYRWNTV